MMTAKYLIIYLLQTTSLVSATNTTLVDIDEAYCLAKNIYYEARGEGTRGQIAVASVTINRRNSKHYPSTICEVVKQKTTLRNTKKEICQFSWYCDGKSYDIISLLNKDGTVNQKLVDQFRNAGIIAINALATETRDPTKGATHFHNPEKSDPAWVHTLQKTATIGNHDFYR